MKKFIPSEQQNVVFNWIENGSGNAFIEAVAGAGKTTTLIEGCIRMKGDVAFAAYNKKIADEIKARLFEKGKDVPGLSNRVQANTFHSFGLKAWKGVHKWIKVDTRGEKRKMMLDENFVTDNYWAFVSKIVSLAKQSGCFLLWNPDDEGKWYDLVERHELDAELEDQSEVLAGIKFAMNCIKWSRANGSKIIDFDDMIWLPAINNVKFDKYDWVLVDEAQDTNPVRRILARKMVKDNGRVVFVGDRHQAIYGFTGADNDAVNQIITDFACELLPLTLTYRCPKNVVKEARGYVSHITAAETAADGKVSAMMMNEFEKTAKELSLIEDAVLCRNTKPLVSLAFKLLRMGIACHIEGRDIGQGLIKLVEKYKVKSLDKLVEKLSDWADKEVTKLIAKKKETLADSVRDRVDTVLAIAENVKTVDELKSKIYSMFKDEDGETRKTLTLSTVHKSKGREWQRVFILEKSKHMPSRYAKQQWQKEQEANLVYVAITRAQSELVYLD